MFATISSAERSGPASSQRQSVLDQIRHEYMDRVVGVRGRFPLSLVPPAEFINDELERIGADWRVSRIDRRSCEFREI